MGTINSSTVSIGDATKKSNFDQLISNDKVLQGNLDALPPQQSTVTVTQSCSVGDPIGYGNGQYRKAGIAISTSSIFSDFLPSTTVLVDMQPMSGVDGGFLVTALSNNGEAGANFVYRFGKWSGTVVAALTAIQSSTVTGQMDDGWIVEMSDDHFMIGYKDTAGEDAYALVIDYNDGTPSVVGAEFQIINGTSIRTRLKGSVVDPDKALMAIQEGTSMRVYGVEWDGVDTITTSVNDTHADAAVNDGRMELVNIGPSLLDPTKELFVVLYQGGAGQVWAGSWLYEPGGDALIEQLAYEQLGAGGTGTHQVVRGAKLDRNHLICAQGSTTSRTVFWYIAEIESNPYTDLARVKLKESGRFDSASQDFTFPSVAVIGGGFYAILDTAGDGVGENTPRVSIFYWNGHRSALLGYALFPIAVESDSFRYTGMALVSPGVLLIAYQINANPTLAVNIAPVFIYKYIGLSKEDVAAIPTTVVVQYGGGFVNSGYVIGDEYGVDYRNQVVANGEFPTRVGRAITTSTLALF